MKAVVFEEFGDESVLRVKKLDDPRPARDQVLIRVKAVGVNHVDLDIRSGASRLPIEFPHILGIEFAGEIVELGADVEGWAVGDRVAPNYQVACRHCPACESGHHMHCSQLRLFGVQLAGGYAELAVANARDLLRVPESVTWDQAAAIQTTYGTAWHCLVTRAAVKPGETVLVSASGSGVGTAAVQIAKMMGATVIATAGSDAKLERARQEGADLTVNYSSQDLTATVMDLTDGRGVDVAFEHVGGEVFGATLNSVATMGRITVCGGHAGEVVPLDLIALFRSERSVLGCARSTHPETRAVLDLVAAGRLHPVAGHSLPLAEASEGHRLINQRSVFGKVVLRP